MKAGIPDIAMSSVVRSVFPLLSVTFMLFTAFTSVGISVLMLKCSVVWISASNSTSIFGTSNPGISGISPVWASKRLV